MSLTTISPQDAKRLLDEGAVLVDIREADEHARERIPQARNVALSEIDRTEIAASDARAVIFHCKSGMRTLGNADKLASSTAEGCDAYVVEGGIDAWRRAGLPVIADKSQPLEIMRQVQIVAGAMALFGTLLGIYVAPGFLILPGLVGAGFLVAGITGFCGMARALAYMPWNKTGKNPSTVSVG
jgi:rhodanese-related sulfurtransferase